MNINFSLELSFDLSPIKSNKFNTINEDDDFFYQADKENQVNNFCSDQDASYSHNKHLDQYIYWQNNEGLDQWKNYLSFINKFNKIKELQSPVKPLSLLSYYQAVHSSGMSIIENEEILSFFSSNKKRVLQLTKNLIFQKNSLKISYVIDICCHHFFAFKHIEKNDQTKREEYLLSNEYRSLRLFNLNNSIPGIQKLALDFDFLKFINPQTNQMTTGYLSSVYTCNYTKIIISRSATLTPLDIKINEFIQILFGIKCVARQNGIHQDIKPANILVYMNQQKKCQLIHHSDWAGGAVLDINLASAEIERILSVPTTSQFYPFEDQKAKFDLILELILVEKQLILLEEELLFNIETDTPSYIMNCNSHKVLTKKITDLKISIFTLAFKSDIYALGTTLFMSFFGSYPYSLYQTEKKKNKPMVKGKINIPSQIIYPDKLKNLFCKMLHPDWMKRPTIDESYHALSEVIKEESTLTSCQLYLKTFDDIFARLFPSK